MSYRRNAKEDAVEEQSKVWKGALIATAIRCLYIVVGLLAASVATSVIYRAMHPAPTPPPTHECHDHATIIRSDTSGYECDEGALLETTRIRRDNATDVLVTCRCNKVASSPDLDK